MAFLILLSASSSFYIFKYDSTKLICDCIYKESLQDGVSYYPNQECNSYEEIENISQISAKRDLKFNELIAGLKK